MEHFFAMVAGILMFTVAIYEYYNKILKGSQPKLSYEARGMVKK
jgi:hypothetical protein